MEQIRLFNDDCLTAMKQLEDNSVDSIVTDPPYGLSFMNKKWDYDVPSIEIWEECLRILKPGGHLLSFSGSRTYHRMAVRIEDAGFEIRDQIMWVYGSGFPKSHNLIKQIEKQNICQFIKNVKTNNAITQLKHIQVELNEGTIGSVLTNVVMYQEEGVENKMGIGVVVDLSVTDMSIFATKQDIEQNTILLLNNLLEENLKKGKRYITLTELKQIIDLKIYNLLQNQNTLKSIETLHGTALKPAHEPIVMARKPFKGSVAENVLKYGTGGINIDESRIEMTQTEQEESYRKPLENIRDGFIKTTKPEYKPEGRFPANIIFDEEAGKILDEQSGIKKSNERKSKFVNYGVGEYAKKDGRKTEPTPNEIEGTWYGDEGGASRFFYCPKANKKDRDEGINNLYLIENNLICEIETLNQQLKDISEDMIKILENQEWNTILFGSNITDQYQQDFKFITSIILKMIIGLKTLNYYPHLNTKDYIVDVIKMIKGNGLSLVDYVEQINLLKQNITNEKMEYHLGVVSAVLPTLLEINKKGKTGNFHATVKPTKLMEYLIKLVTPKNGIVLDPFMGSGSTGKAAIKNNFGFIGIEREKEYFEIAKARIEYENTLNYPIEINQDEL